MSSEKAKLEQYFRSIQNNSSQNYASQREQRDWAASDRQAAQAERNRRETVREATYEESRGGMRAEGVVWLRRSAEAQNEFAMAMLGEVLLDGNDAEKNSTEAVAWIKKSIELGSVQGKLKFANLLIAGKLVPQDKATALKLFGEAAPDSPAAANSYGVSLWRGDLGRQDVAEGLEWLEASLKAEYWMAGRNLAKIYYLGSGVPKSPSRAEDYLAQAVRVGGEPAKRLAAEAYEKGEIIYPDESMAEKLYGELASENPAQNAVLEAAYMMRWAATLGSDLHPVSRINLHPARLMHLRTALSSAERGERAGSAEATRMKAEIEVAIRQANAGWIADGERILAEALPHLREKLEANLALLEAAAAKPAENRPAFFTYHGFGIGNWEKDDDYTIVEHLPESPGREIFLTSLDVEKAVEGNFEAAAVYCAGYYHGDPALGPRYFTAVRKIVFADANGGDTSAMVKLVNLLGVPSDERPYLGWPRDHRESFRWFRRALLAGNARGTEAIARLCSAEKPAENMDKKILAQWAAVIETILEINKNDEESAALIAAYCKDHLPPE